MINLSSILFFIAVLSTLILVRTVFRFISSLLSNPPYKMVLGNWELLILGFSISYLLTYIVKL